MKRFFIIGIFVCIGNIYASELSKEVKHQVTVPCSKGYALVTFYQDGTRLVERYNTTDEESLIVEMANLTLQIQEDINNG